MPTPAAPVIVQGPSPWIHMPRLARRAAAALALVFPALAHAQSAPDAGAFVVRLGADTIAVERYRITGSRVEGEALNRTPLTVRRRWSTELGADGAPTRFAYQGQRVNRSAPPTIATMTFGAGAVDAAVSAGGRDTTLRVATTGGAMPFVYGVYSHYELALRQLARSGADSIVVAMVGVGAPEATPLVARRLGADSMTFAIYEPHAYRVRVDRDGRLLGADGRATTSKVTIERVADVDLDAIAAAWAARDSAGASMGALSPLDSARATIGGAEVTVVYSRPSLRGRRLMGLLVPYDEVWRTGANAATILRTSRDLDLAGTRIPAGSYSLWTVPTRDGATLVVNRQTGQWGTEHDPAHDLARIPLTVARASAPAEQFTFAVQPSATGGTLRYTWGDMVWSAGFVVK